MTVFIENILKSQIWHFPQVSETVFGSYLAKYPTLEHVLVIRLPKHQIYDQKRSHLATFGQFLLKINMERGPGAISVTWVQLGWAQEVYQAFSHSLRYMDFISKVSNHDQMGN